MKATILLTMFFFLLLPSISAQNISFIYPEKVYVGEEFTATLRLIDFSQGVYDVKFDTSNSGGNLLKILNNEQWRSSFYYINSIISNDEEKKFTLKSEKYVGALKITIKIRLTGTNNVESFGGYEIEINPISQENDEQIKTEETENNENNNDATIQQNITTEVKQEASQKNPIQTPIINLSPKDIKSENNSESLNGNYAIYWFIAFSILIVVLFMLRKNRYKNEFR